MGSTDRFIDQSAAAGAAAAHAATVLTPVEDGYAAFPVGVRATVTATDDRVYFVPFSINRRCDVVKLGIEITTGAASTAARVGVYSSTALGAPDALLAEAAATIATTGAATTTTDFTTLVDLPIGTYFAAVKVDGAAVVLRGVNGDSAFPANGDALADVDGAAGAGEVFYAQSAVATALPSAVTLNAAKEPIAPLVIVQFNNVEA